MKALTAPTPAPNGRMTEESLALLEAQRGRLEERRRRESVASERAARISVSRSKSLERERNRNRTTASGNGMDKAGAEDQKLGLGESIEGLTPESVRLLREREKLVRWKAEREKGEFEKREREREEVVRRANEKEGLKKKKDGKRRGCLGLFGR